MPYRPTAKTEAKKAVVRANLLAAARRLFAEHGYESTTLQQIVKEANTSIGNCYFYFENKEAILLTLADDFRREVARKIDEAIAPLPLGPGLLAVAVYTGVLAVLEEADVARFTLLDSALPSMRPIALELFAARAQRAFESMPDLFPRREESTPQLAASAWQGAANYVLEGLVTGRIVEPPEKAARFLARWNLAALGIPEESIRQAMAALGEINVRHMPEVSRS
jgi:AcrR family transcriptional regulator